MGVWVTDRFGDLSDLKEIYDYTDKPVVQYRSVDMFTNS